MNSLKSLVRRDIKIFYRTKGNIFFSVLSIMILVGLHFLIFRNMMADNWEQILLNFPQTNATRENLLWITDMLMFGAILPIGAVTISLTTLGLMVSDKEANVLSDFMVSPIRRNGLLSSYLVSSLIIGILVSLGFLAFFEVYSIAVYDFGFSLVSIIWIILSIICSLIFANIFMLLLISFFKTQQSLGVVGTIVGTLIGFFSGAYVSVGMFGEAVRNVFSSLPFLQLTVLSRSAFLHSIYDVTPLTKEIVSGELARDIGLELWLGDTHIGNLGVLGMVSATTLVLLIALIIRFKRMKKSD